MIVLTEFFVAAISGLSFIYAYFQLKKTGITRKTSSMLPLLCAQSVALNIRAYTCKAVL